jgi:hypothetical protein
VFETLGIAGITISMLAYVRAGNPSQQGTLLCRGQPPGLGHVARWEPARRHRRRQSRGLGLALQFTTLVSAASILFWHRSTAEGVCETHAANPAHELTFTGGPR